MERVNDDIKDIKEAMLQHNKDDNEHFSNIAAKMSESHDIHVRNEEVLKSILAQTQKTNGRVTNLEGIVQGLTTSNALLSQQCTSLFNIVSKQDSQYEKFVIQQEKKMENTESQYVSKDEFAPVKRFVYGLISIVLLSVIGAILTLVVGVTHK